MEASFVCEVKLAEKFITSVLGASGGEMFDVPVGEL